MLSNEILMEIGSAIDYLAERLKEGSLALVIGAGTSRDLGLPDWYGLVDACLKVADRAADVRDLSESNLPIKLSDPVTNTRLLELIDNLENHIDNPDIYKRIVHTALYQSAHIDFQTFKNPLLIALGALIVGAKRGNVKEILNFNFDSVLEYYLKLYGFQVDVVHDLPILRKDRDATIYHPHGYLPFGGGISDFSNFLILSEYSYDQRLGASQDKWKDLTRDFFLRKVCLFIGLSGDDTEIKAISADVSEQIANNRPTGFWLFDSTIQDTVVNKLLRRNIVPIQFRSHDSYPEFLLNICQKASEL